MTLLILFLLLIWLSQ